MQYFSIEQVGSIACHKGVRSCFYKGSNLSDRKNYESIFLPPLADACSELFEIIKDRELNPKKGSYTNSLLEGGDNKILKKIGEEAAEVVMACKDKDKESISNEAADLIFHLQVALRFHDVDWRDVLRVLNNRKSPKNLSTP